MQPTKHFLRIQLFDSNREQDPKLDPNQAERTDSNKEYVHPYSNAQQIIYGDPYHENSADWNKKNSKDELHPYYEWDVTILSNQYDLFRSPKTAEDDVVASSSDNSLQEDSFVSSLDIHRPLDLLKRLRTDDDRSSRIEKRMRFNQSSPVSSSQENSQSDCAAPLFKIHWSDLFNAANNNSTNSLANIKHSRCNRLNSHYNEDSGYQRSHFLCQSPGDFGYAPNALASPATKEALRNSLGSPLKVKLNKHGSPTKAVTSAGETLRRSAKTKIGYTYTAAANKPKRYRCSYNKVADAGEPKFAPLTRHSASIKLDESRLDKFLGVRKSWSTSIGKVMGMSAEEAAVASGVEVKGEFHWLHLFAFSMGGYDGVEPNEEQNFVLGTAGANGFHLRMEDTIKELVRKHGEIEVRYSMDPNQDEFDPKWHLCGRFTYEFWWQDECVDSIVIDTLDTQFPSLTDNTCFTVFGEVKIERNKAKKNSQEWF